MSVDAASLGILGPAWVAGLLVVATHVPFGREVLARGIIFIDLAVAQVAGLGVIAAHAFGWEAQGYAVQLVAVAAALAAGLVLSWTDRRWPHSQEALIGSLFVLAASGGVLLLSHNPHGGEHLKELLVGQILWVSYGDLAPVAIVYAAVLGAWLALRRRLPRLGFYLLFALTVTASVQLVGVYLVFATLIIPALAARAAPARLGLVLGYGLGAAAYALGLVLSLVADLPAGALIVWCLAGLGVAAALVGQRGRGRR